MPIEPKVLRALEGAHAGVVRSRAHNLSGKAEPSPTIALYKQSFDDAYRALTTLLKHLRQDVTGLSVAFSGNAITVDAAIAQAAKVDTNLDRLVACIVAVPKETCLRQEWRKGVENVAEQVQHLIETLIADAEAPATNTSTSVASSSTAKPPPKPYLIATSATWEAIDQLLQNASSSEKDAIKSVWKQDQAYMTDAYTEFKELLEEDEGIGGEEENEEEDDEWAALERELGGSTETMTEEERARITGLDVTIRLIMASHARFTRSTLDIEEAIKLPDHVETSHSLARNLDELVSNLYAPQNLQALQSGIDATLKDVTRLADLSLEAIKLHSDNDLTKKVEQMSLKDESTNISETVLKEEKWMKVLKEQLAKAETARSST